MSGQNCIDTLSIYHVATSQQIVYREILAFSPFSSPVESKITDKTMHTAKTTQR